MALYCKCAVYSASSLSLSLSLSQVRGIHDEYQVFEKEFHAAIGDSLTRLASPAGSPEAKGSVNLCWERGEDTDMESQYGDEGVYGDDGGEVSTEGLG